MDMDSDHRSLPSHLQYATVEDWIEGEGITTSIIEIADPVERDRQITEYGELRQHLFAKHVETLSAEERSQFANGRHPSQSHSFADRAEPFVEALSNYLNELGFKAKVSLGWYHGDRIILYVDLEKDPQDRSRELPWLFRGFETRLHLAPTIRNQSLIQSSAIGGGEQVVGARADGEWQAVTGLGASGGGEAGDVVFAGERKVGDCFMAHVFDDVECNGCELSAAIFGD